MNPSENPDTFTSPSVYNEQSETPAPQGQQYGLEKLESPAYAFSVAHDNLRTENAPLRDTQALCPAPERHTINAAGLTIPTTIQVSELIMDASVATTLNQLGLRSSKEKSPSYCCEWIRCGHTFNRRADLLRHLRSVHLSPVAARCPVQGCGQTFGRRDHLRHHMRRSHNDKNALQTSHGQQQKQKRKDNGDDGSGTSKPCTESLPSSSADAERLAEVTWQRI
ncbi:hypothetical protein BDW72DRAFT_187942 [Aspergillus terricola var. indicus]